MNARCLARLAPACAVIFFWGFQPVGAVDATEATEIPVVPATGAAASIEPIGITIDQALDLMVRNDPMLRAAAAGTDAARAAVHDASRMPNPTLSVESSGISPTRPRTNSETGRTFAVGLEQLIETAGKRGWRTAGARYQQLAAEASARDALRQRILVVHSAFYGAILAREDEAVAEDVLASIAHSEALMRTRVAEGALPAGELIRFQVGKVQYQQARLAARLRYDQSMRNLLTAIAPPSGVPCGSDASAGWPNGAAVVPKGDLGAPPSTVTLDDLRGSAAERPDVLVARMQVEAATATLRLADAQRVPDVRFGVGANLQGAEYTVGVSASIELPVFNTYRGASAQAAAQLRQAQAQFFMARSAAVNDAEQVWLAYDSARQLLAVYSDETLQRARRGFEIADAAYREGATGLLDVLEARRAYDEIRTAYNQARFAVRMGLVEVEHLGTAGGSSTATPGSSGGGGGNGND